MSEESDIFRSMAHFRHWPSHSMGQDLTSPKHTMFPSDLYVGPRAEEMKGPLCFSKWSLTYRVMVVDGQWASSVALRPDADLEPRGGHPGFSGSVLSPASGSLQQWGKEDWRVLSLWTLGFLEIPQHASGVEHRAFRAMLSGKDLEISHGLLGNPCISITPLHILYSILASGKASLAWRRLLKWNWIGEEDTNKREIKWSAYI